jgi:hypothetical protein
LLLYVQETFKAKEHELKEKSEDAWKKYLKEQGGPLVVQLVRCDSGS